MIGTLLSIAYALDQNACRAVQMFLPDPGQGVRVVTPPRTSSRSWSTNTYGLVRSSVPGSLPLS